MLNGTCWALTALEEELSCCGIDVLRLGHQLLLQAPAESSA